MRVGDFDVPSPTNANGQFVYLVDHTLLGRHVVTVTDTTGGTIGRAPLTDGQRTALKTLQASIDVIYAVRDIAVSRTAGGDPVITGRLVDASGTGPPAPGLLTYQLTGTVTDASGKPVTGAQVSTRTLDRDYWTISTPTDANGRYSSLFTASSESQADPVPFTVRVSMGNTVYQFLPQEFVFFDRLESATMDLRLPPTGYAMAIPRPVSYPGAVYTGIVAGARAREHPCTPRLDHLAGSFRPVRDRASSKPGRKDGFALRGQAGALLAFNRPARRGNRARRTGRARSRPMHRAGSRRFTCRAEHRAIPEAPYAPGSAASAEASSTSNRTPDAGRTTGELVPVVVEVGGRVDVEVRPGAVVDEALEERGREDRIAEASPGRVLEVCERRLQELRVARMQRHRPGEVPGRVPGGDDDAAPRAVVGEDPDVAIAEGGADAAGESGDIDEPPRPLLLREPEPVGQDEPSLGVGIGDLDRQARCRVQHVSGAERGAVDHVLGGGKHPEDSDGEARARRWRRPRR